MGTRDVLISLAMTAVFIILTDHLFNEKSGYCVIPHNLRIYEDLIDENDDGKISEEEINKARKTLEKAKSNEIKRNHLQQLENFTSRTIY